MGVIFLCSMILNYVADLPSSSGSGIGKGAVAGIVVGTVAGSVILSATVSILIFRRQIRKNYAAIKSRRSEYLVVTISKVTSNFIVNFYCLVQWFEFQCVAFFIMH